jgi:hypothetical protein
MQTRFYFLLFLSAFFTLNARGADPRPLQFQADKNNVQILPQRFEYNIGDENHIQLGDIIIDSTSFGFQVAPGAHPGQYRARFVWPAGLLKEGTLSVKDHTGKTIWSTEVNPSNTKQTAPAAAKGANNLLRTQVNEFITDQLGASVVEDMKYLPFMNFCINRKTDDTNIYLCSKEVFLAVQQGKLGIRSRSQGKRQAFVEINGKSVGNQGIIFLNDENENIGFRAMTQSGSVLEIETRVKTVDFKDLVQSPDQKNLILTASGAEPVNEEKVHRLSPTDWQITIDAQRPVFYLKGAGDIPMRQEFYAKGAIPAEAARPHLAANSVQRLYAADLELSGQAAPGTTVSAGGKGQRVEKLDASQFRWNLSDLPTGERSRHYLKVNDGKNNFLAFYDVYRDYALEGGLHGAYWVPAGQLYGSGFIHWWLENFLGIGEDWARLHWGVRAEESLVLNKKDTEANLTITHLELQWRAEAGFHFMDPTWGLLLPLEMISATGINTVSPGLGGFYSAAAPTAWQSWLHWYDAKAVYLLGGGGTVKLKSAIQLQALGYYHVDKRLSWNYGAGLNQYSFDGGTNKMQVELLGGASYRF